MESTTEKLHTMAGHGKTRPKNSGSKKLFDNPILEALSRTHIMVPISMWLVLIGVFRLVCVYVYGHGYQYHRNAICNGPTGILAV